MYYGLVDQKGECRSLLVVVVVLRSHVIVALLVRIALVGRITGIGLIGLIVAVDDGVIVVVVLWILLVRVDQVAV